MLRAIKEKKVGGWRDGRESNKSVWVIFEQSQMKGENEHRENLGEHLAKSKGQV